MSNLKLLLLALPAFLLGGATGMRAQTYMLNQFGTGSSQPTPSNTQSAGVIDVTNGVTTQWYESAANLTLSNGAMLIGPANAAYYGFFTNNPPDISGAAGASIQLTFDISTTGATASGNFKIGLFNSHANLTGNGYVRPTLTTAGTGLITAGSGSVTTATQSQPYLNWSGYYLNLTANSGGNNSQMGMQF